MDRNKYDEKESNYVVKLYNSEGFNYRHVKLDKKNLMIKKLLIFQELTLHILEIVKLKIIYKKKGNKMMKVNIGLIGIFVIIVLTLVSISNLNSKMTICKKN